MAKDDAKIMLTDEILQDARRKAEETVSAAKATADKILAEAKLTAKTESEKILSEHRARTGKRAEMTLRMVEQRVASGKLRARDVVIRLALDQAWARLKEISGDEYVEAVVRLAALAASQMPGGDSAAKVTAIPGLNVDENALAARIAAALQKAGKAGTVRVQVQTGPSKGVVVESADGKLRWDNTFEARLRRLRPSLRRLAIPILFEEV